MQPAAQREPVVAACCPEAGGAEAIDFGLAISRLSGAPLTVVVVTPPSAARLDDAAARWSAGKLGRLTRTLERRALGQADVRLVTADTPARGLAQALDELAPALIALGPRRDAHAARRLGTTAHRVLHVSSCPVALVPAGYRPPARGVWTIGAAFTATVESRRALRAAAALASAGGGRLWVLALDAADQPAKGLLRDVISALPAGLAVEFDLRVEAPADGLIAASPGLDLLVLASRGSGPPRAVRLGRVSRAVIERAACPVLLLPRADSPP